VGIAAILPDISGWQRFVRPFDIAPNAQVRDELVKVQFERLRAHVPIMCLALVLTAAAATIALFGDLPYAMQFLPPAVILTSCTVLYFRWRKRPTPTDPVLAFRPLQNAPRIAALMGVITGIWCVNAFSETEQYYCVVAPVFVAMAVLMAANGLASVPNAAATAVIGTITPIAIKMLMFDNLGIRCIAIMLIVIGAMQLHLIYEKFDETARMIALQLELKTLASTDPLSSLGNRRAFDDALEGALAAPTGRVSIAMIDLDGFKPANDRFGHAAGDAILVEVARRLTTLFPDAACVARIGGDEFALLFAEGLDESRAFQAAKAIRTILALPYTVETNIIPVSASAGFAVGPVGSPPEALLSMADAALYADKASRKGHGKTQAKAA
jgi:diguanylate cyclase (GGDEF)-like protein